MLIKQLPTIEMNVTVLHLQDSMSLISLDVIILLYMEVDIIIHIIKMRILDLGILSDFPKFLFLF